MQRPAARLLLFAALTCVCHAASFNCSLAHSSREKLVCSNSELSSLDDKVAAAYKIQQAQLSPPSAALVRQDQRDWLPWLDKVCPAHNKRNDDPVRCLIDRYEERLSDLTGNTVLSGIHFYTRAHFVYVLGDPTIFPNTGFGKGQFDWPQIDRPTPAQRTWNDAIYKATVNSACCMDKVSEKTLNASVGPFSDIRTTFSIHAADAHFIGTQINTYDYEGGAHGIANDTTFAWWLDASRPLQADDIFNPNSDWQATLATLTLAKLLIDPGPDALWKPGPYIAKDELQKGIAAGTSRPSAWCISPQGLTITFAEYEVGPYSSGMPSATFTWQELKPLLAHSLHPAQLPAALPSPNAR